MRALSAAACIHVHGRHLILMACRKFGVTTPDIKARERGRERGRRGERARGHGGKSTHERYWFKDISSFSTYFFSYRDFTNKLCIICCLSEGLWQPAWLQTLNICRRWRWKCVPTSWNCLGNYYIRPND